jgi:hypothetical protein
MAAFNKYLALNHKSRRTMKAKEAGDSQPTAEWKKRVKVIFGMVLGAIAVVLFVGIQVAGNVSPESLRQQANQLQQAQQDLAASKERVQKAKDQTCRQTGLFCRS